MNELELWLEENGRRLFWIVGIVAGILQAVADRVLLSPDGGNYLNVAQACAERGWHAGINGYWSPLYPWLCALLMRVGIMKPAFEVQMLHVLGFFIFIATMGGFEFFLDGLLRGQESRRTKIQASDSGKLGLFRCVAYLAFLLVMLGWLPNGLTTPDLLVALFALVAGGFVVRLNHGIQPIRSSLGLGSSLAFGYLAKAAMFPYAVLVLFLLFFFRGRLPGSRMQRLLAHATFLLLASPFLIALSVKLGKPTFGESGRVAYLQYANDYPPWWIGEDFGGAPGLRGFHRVATVPPLLVPDAAVPGGSLQGDDPSRWYRGLQPHFQWRRQLRVLADTSSVIGSMLTSYGEMMLALAIVLILCGKRRRKRILQQVWPLAVPVLFVTFMYSLVHVEERFLAGFFLIVWVGILGSCVFVCSRHGRVARLVLLGLLFVFSVRFVTKEVRTTASALFFPHSNPTPEVLRSLTAMGVDPGAKIGELAGGEPTDSYFVRAGRYSIVAELSPSSSALYFASGGPAQTHVDEAFVQAGARALLTLNREAAALPEWRNVPSTPMFVKILRASSNSNQVSTAQRSGHNFIKANSR